MRKFQRGPEPDFLTANSAAWTKAWQTAQADKRPFRWPIHNHEPVNRKILPPLKAQTQDHCSFCDNYPVSPPSVDTIEHFRPKSKYPEEAFSWLNLYYCCTYCQQRRDDFDEAALRPDAEDYRFDRYFRWDWTRGTLDVNEQASPEDQQRARVTIALYRLNQEHPRLRKRELRRRDVSRGEALDDFAYRDYVDNIVC